jgi:hypothetical protein
LRFPQNASFGAQVAFSRAVQRHLIMPFSGVPTLGSQKRNRNFEKHHLPAATVGTAATNLGGTLLMFDARDYDEDQDMDRRRPSQSDRTSRNSTSANRGRARRSSAAPDRKKTGGGVGGMHNRKNKHWNW